MNDKSAYVKYAVKLSYKESDIDASSVNRIPISRGFSPWFPFMALSPTEAEVCPQVDARCHILTLPNELLYNILSLVLPSASLNLPVLTVRSVCKTFRLIADQLPFWYEEDFHFHNIDRHLCLRRTPSFVETLLKDPHLVECLSRKTSWSVHSIDLFDVLLDNLPRMATNTTKLDFYFVKYAPERRPLDALRYFKSLEYLRVHTSVSSSIGEFPSSLRTLHIRNDSHSCLPYAGLDNVRHLHEFSYVQWFTVQDNLPMCLPIESSASLSKLTLDLAHDVDYSILDTFVNLRTLVMKRGPAQFFTFLQRSRLQLDNFSLTLPGSPPIDVARIADALEESSALRKLSQLNITFLVDVYDHLPYDNCEPIISAITKLRYLEELDMYLPLCSQWCRHFENCTHVRKIRWQVPRGCFPPKDVQTTFLAYVQHLDPTPSVTIVDSLGRPPNEWDSHADDDDNSDDDADGDNWYDDPDYYFLEYDEYGEESNWEEDYAPFDSNNYLGEYWEFE